MTVLEPLVRERGQVSSLSPVRCVLALYERLARARLGRRGAHVPLDQLDREMQQEQEEMQDRRTLQHGKPFPVIQMQSSVMSEAEQLYEEAYDGSFVCI